MNFSNSLFIEIVFNPLLDKPVFLHVFSTVLLKSLLKQFLLENKRALVRSPALPIFFPHSHRCPLFRQWLYGKAWKEYCAVYWLKELLESMDRCTGCRDKTEILLKTALNTIQSVNGAISFPIVLYTPLKNPLVKGNIE